MAPQAADTEREQRPHVMWWLSARRTQRPGGHVRAQRRDERRHAGRCHVRRCGMGAAGADHDEREAARRGARRCERREAVYGYTV